MKWFSIFLSLILLGFLLSCDSLQTSSVSNSGSALPTKSIKAENAIVYLFFTIEKNANGNELIKLTETKTAEGTIKKGSIINKEDLPGNISISFLGKDGNILSEQIIEDPLHPMMEIYEDGNISKEKMNLPKAEFSIRFNQDGTISSVLLEKINTESKTKLITIKL